jgi:hypothetical protein
MPDRFEVRGEAQFVAEQSAKIAKIIERGREADGFVTKAEKEKSAILIFGKAPEQFLLQKVPAFVPGRSSGCPPLPPQTRTCPIKASGSSVAGGLSLRRTKQVRCPFGA